MDEGPPGRLADSRSRRAPPGRSLAHVQGQFSKELIVTKGLVSQVTTVVDRTRACEEESRPFCHRCWGVKGPKG